MMEGKVDINGGTGNEPGFVQRRVSFAHVGI